MSTQDNQSHRKQRRGFTLIELVLVLIILAILASAALNLVEVQVDQTRFETTQRTINNVDNAIFAEKQGADGRSFMSGFTVDMGRPPILLPDPDDATILTLRELWAPTGLPAYQSRQATAADVSPTTDSDGETVAADQNVRISAGWRGPYLQLPVGATQLTDGWGHRMVSLTTGADYSHLRGDGDTDINSVNTSVYGVRSLGRDDAVSGPTAYDIDSPSTVNGITLAETSLEGTIRGTVYVDDTLTPTPSTTNVVVQIYFPDETNAAQISVERAELAAQAPTVPGYDSFNFTFEVTGGGEVLFPVGPRVIRAYFDSGSDGSGDFNDGTNDPPNQSQPGSVTVVPSTNGVELTITP
jgi:prepilin-type N-terminal cleavage/methylation domain-containing protein